MLKGIDISKWQNGIDLGAIETDFIICKATEGIGYTDKTCDKFYQKAKSLGKKLGVYHFARPDLGNSGRAEADYFLKETKGYWKESLLILDWEPQGNSISNVSWAKEWLDRVYEVVGVKPLIYMSASVMRAYDWSSVAGADYGLWIANYGINDGQVHDQVFNNYPLKYWSFYALWQYSSRGHLNGYNGNLDVNYFSGDLSAWDKYAGCNSSTTTKPIKKSIEEMANEIINDVNNEKWGTDKTNPTRKERLTSAGYNYDEVQAKVNEILGINKQPSYITYKVKKGDTLIKIAKEYGTTYKKIAKDNNIINANKIYTGQVLKIYK